MRTTRWMLAAVLGVLAAGRAEAGQITFDGLAGQSNGSAFTTYTEGGFTVAATDDHWNVTTVYGNPSPDIYSTTAPATVEVTQVAPGPFTFSQVDLSSDSSAPADNSFYSVVGYLGSLRVFGFEGSVPGGLGNTFQTITNTDPGAAIDRLAISYTRFTGIFGGLVIDNIVVTPAAVATPEPGTLAQAGAGALALGLSYGWRRGRRKAG